MKKTYRLFLGMLLLLTQAASAQTKEVSGRVTDAKDGSPLPGVTISVKNGTANTVTLGDGSFKLSVPENASTLVFSFVGYADQEQPVSAIMNVRLSAADQSLSEVVVVGYGTKIKREVTSSISKVTAKDFENQPLPSFEQALQGRAAGVFINAGSGKLGQGLDIKIRGIASISAGAQPLIVIDGVPVTNTAIGTEVEADNPLAALNPDDIASIDVLKDAASAAIYGARGSNGVILVTTKSGKVGKTRVNVNVSHGFSDATHLRKFLNAAQYKELLGASLKNRYGYNDTQVANFWNTNIAAPGKDEWNSSVDENWSERGIQKGYVDQYSISLSGGDARTKYLLSAGYNDQKGIILGNRLTRATGRMNIDHSINDKFKIGANLSLFRTNNERLPNDNAFANPIQLNAIPPIQPAYTADGNLNDYTVYYNNLFDQKYAFSNAVGYKTISSAYGEYQILSGLKLRSQVGVDFNNFQEEQYNGKETLDGAPSGLGYNSQSTNYVLTSTTTLNWDKEIADKHKIDVIGGTEFTRSSYTNVQSQGENFPSSRFTKLASSSKITAGSSSQTGYSFVSYFARGNYMYNDKYLVGASLRVDGSSRFGKDNRYGIFPAASVGWIISEENFLKNSNAISFLKLRASYGKTGNAEIGNFASLTLVSAAAYADMSGIDISQLGNSDLTWEKTDQFDVGLDFGVLDNRITGEVDYFYKNTQDMLLNVSLPAVNGFTAFTTNIGSMKNTGFELVINTRNLVGEFKWNTSFNISTYRNEVTKLVTPISPSGNNLGRLEVGQPFGQFYGFKYMGVDPQNGDALYLAKDGKTTVNYQNLSQAGKFILGNPNPDFYGGINNSFSYKGFALDVQCQFVSGNNLYNAAGIYQSANGDYLDNQTIDQMNYWKTPGQITNIPRPFFAKSNGTETSSRWIEDGSYFRVKSATLSYNLPRALVSRAKLNNVRVYVAGSNLLTVTNYSGYDPEVNSGINSALNIGHDFYTPPQIRTISFGLSVGL